MQELYDSPCAPVSVWKGSTGTVLKPFAKVLFEAAKEGVEAVSNSPFEKHFKV